jgi:hypothetical protein
MSLRILEQYIIQNYNRKVGYFKRKIFYICTYWYEYMRLFCGKDVFRGGRIVIRTFSGRTFCGRTFCRKDILSRRILCDRTFCTSTVHSS